MIYLKIVTLKERGGLNKLKAVLFAAAFFLCLSSSFAQQKEEADSLVRLMEANAAQLLEINGESYRKIVGPARFLHNNTYLLCDTALWNINTNIIDAIGHVQVIQENTFLRSDRIEYVVNENLAKFRGSIVELFDKDGNILKTNYLDYNTKDSIALFYNGGAMSNPKGDLIESVDGAYYAKEKLFSFTNLVNMFTDSVFILSNKIDYRTDLNKAYFGKGTTAWQQDNILYTDDGEFDRPNDIFRFNRNSYILTREQEIWADLLTYARKTGDADLYDNVQIVDTLQSTIALADKAMHRPQIMTTELTRKPAIGLYSVEKGIKDTLFIAADTLRYYKKRYYEIDSAVIAQAKERKNLSDIDPIAIAESKMIVPSVKMGMSETPLKNANTHTTDSLSVSLDSLSAPPVLPDSLLRRETDSLKIVEPLAKDTTLVHFVDAYHHVRMYRKDMQGLCDSLVYTGIDSMIRFYKDPILWNDVKNQFTADSIQVVLKNNALSKANLLSNAFIISKEDSIHFSQIKSPEMAAYFANNDLYRYDALGGVSAIFFLQEDSIVSIMNQKESKMLSVKLKEQQVQRLKYFEQIKNDAHPVFNLPMDKQKLRGFNWRVAERPLDRNSVTTRSIKSSDRNRMEEAATPIYEYSKLYFPQRRDSIMTYRREVDSMKVVRLQQIEAERIRKEQERLKQEQDSLIKVQFRDDSLSRSIVSDSLQAEIGADSKTRIEEFSNEKKLSKREIKREEKRLKREKRRFEKAQKRLERKKRADIKKQKRYFSKNKEVKTEEKTKELVL